MSSRKRLSADNIKNEPWGPAFLQEMDAVIAQGEFQSLNDGVTLYNDVLNQRVGDYCAKFDLDLVENYLGIIDVNHQTFKYDDDFVELHENIIGAPRGTWAIFQLNGKYDAMMSDGVGGFGALTGRSFDSNSPVGRGLSFREQYGALLSWMIYNRRGEIRNRIIQYSASNAKVELGTIAKNVYMLGKTWSKVELISVKNAATPDGNTLYEIKASRPGVKLSDKDISAEIFNRIFGVPPTLPLEFEKNDGVDRTLSLTERRIDAAQQAWESYDRIIGNANLRYGSRAPFKQIGNDFTRTVYQGIFPEVEAVGEFVVEFSPGSTEIIDAVIRSSKAEPTP